jgi:hypothetical protein
MKILSASILFVIVFCGSCCKKNITPQPYILATVILGEETNCFYNLQINGTLYTPINLPLKYQKWSGVPEENTLLITYKLLKESDLAVCKSFINGQRLAYRKLEILQIKQ